MLNLDAKDINNYSLDLLDRLKSELQKNDLNVKRFYNLVQEEQLKISRIFNIFSTFSDDLLVENHLEKRIEIDGEGYFILKVPGDGNCFFSSFSKIICGNCDFANLLRAKFCLERAFEIKDNFPNDQEIIGNLKKDLLGHKNSAGKWIEGCTYKNSWTYEESCTTICNVLKRPIVSVIDCYRGDNFNREGQMLRYFPKKKNHHHNEPLYLYLNSNHFRPMIKERNGVEFLEKKLDDSFFFWVFISG